MFTDDLVDLDRKVSSFYVRSMGDLRELKVCDQVQRAGLSVG